MDSDLFTVARTLAERGWLPGIDNSFVDTHLWCAGLYATEADFHLAAMRQVRKINGTVLFGEQWVKLMVHDPRGIRMAKTYDESTKQGDTLALLRCLLVACEASKETTNDS
jgi:hypothetical protein